MSTLSRGTSSKVAAVFFSLVLLLAAASFKPSSSPEALSLPLHRADPLQPEPSLLPNLQGEQAKEFLHNQGLHSSLAEAVSTARYKVYRGERGEAGFYADNPALGMSMVFDDGATHLRVMQPVDSTRGEGQAGAPGKVSHGRTRHRVTEARLRLIGAGYGERILATTGKPAMTAETNRFSYHHRFENNSSLTTHHSSFVTEWYINRAEGIEHGFTLNAPPMEREADELLRVEIGIAGGLRPKVKPGGKGLMLQGRHGIEVSYDGLKVTDARGKELDSRMRVSGRTVSIEVLDLEAEYPVMIDPVIVTEVAKIVASDREANDSFGRSVAISGATAIIGVFGEDTGGFHAGAAYIFDRDQGGTNNWGEVRKILASDRQPGDRFGESVGISGYTAIIGAYLEDTGGTSAGAAYIFERHQGGTNNWGEVRKLQASDPDESDRFGISVAISGDTAIVGAFGDDPGAFAAGAAYIFDRNQGGLNNWGEVRKIFATDAAIGDAFGMSVAISGDLAIVGAFSEETDGVEAGAAYIFERNQGGANNWGEVRKLLPSDPETDDRFGVSVTINGDTAIVGADLEDTGGVDAGAAYVFERNQGGLSNWGEVRKLLASDTEAGDEFGRSVSINGDIAIVGAWFESTGGQRAGSAYVFERDEGGSDKWGEVRKTQASDRQAFAGFGISVSISGGTTIVGAIGESTGGFMAGAAYLFITNSLPTISTQPLSLQLDSSTTAAAIAVVKDDLTPAANLSVTVVSSPPAITLSNITNTNGTIRADVSAGCSAALGVNTVTLSVMDEHGLVSTADLILTLAAELTPPVVSCPTNTAVAAGAGQCSAVVNFTATATDNCSVASVMCNPRSGSSFPVGTTTVNCTATDTSSNTAQCSFTVTVDDTQAPSVSCPAPISANNGASQCSAVVSFGATAVDNCDGALTPGCSPPSGSTFPVGTTTVTCTAIDAAGNTGQCSFTVTVADAQAPTVSCPAPISVNNAANQCSALVNFSAAAADNCDGATTPGCSPPSGSAFPVGATTVTCTATDKAGNTGRCSFTVTVRDTQKPSITCPPNILLQTVNPGDATVVVNYAQPVASDNCAAQSEVCKPPSGSAFPVGTTTVTCTATDPSGNSSSCSFQVSTLDFVIKNDTTNTFLRLNSLTGDYEFIDCIKGVRMTGKAVITRSFCKIEIKDSGADPKKPDRSVVMTINTCTRTATGTVRPVGSSSTYNITDTNIANNPLGCS